MKSLVLIAMLTAALAQQPAKPASTPAAGKPAAPHVSSTVAPAKKPDAATTLPDKAAISITPIDAPAANTTRDNDLATKLMWFTGALAVFAGLQLIMLVLQGTAIRKMLKSVTTNAEQMEYQSRVLDDQLKVMTDQLVALKDTASAASSSAAAAQETVQLIASKERARLRVELQPFYLNFDAPSPASFTIQHLGSTDAYVLNSRAAVYVSDSHDPDPMVGAGKPIPIPSVISPKNPVVVGEDVLHPFSSEEIDRIRELKSFVHFTGSIRYKDVFEGEHETRFNRVWRFAPMNNLNGDHFTYWELCGSEEENIET